MFGSRISLNHRFSLIFSFVYRGILYALWRGMSLWIFCGREGWRIRQPVFISSINKIVLTNITSYFWVKVNLQNTKSLQTMCVGAGGVRVCAQGPSGSVPLQIEHNFSVRSLKCVSWLMSSHTESPASPSQCCTATEGHNVGDSLFPHYPFSIQLVLI